jgi:hypothetical protein
MGFLSALFVALAAGCSNSATAPMSGKGRGLDQQVDEQKRTTARAVDAYSPKVVGDINDLTAPAADILRQLPGVDDAEVLVTCSTPSYRIVHLRDWRFITHELFVLDTG